MRYFDIGPNEGGQRIDNFLLKVLKNIPRSHVYRLMRSGQVRVNKGRVKPAYKLQVGDQVRVPPVRQPEAQVLRPPDALCERITQRVIYEDAGLLVIDKPSGVAVHGGSGVKFGLIEIMRFARPDLEYLELAHRLDRATSGCLVLAKSRHALTWLHDGFRDGLHEKQYLTLLHGAWQGGAVSVADSLQSQRLEGGERIVKTAAEGKTALSHFRPLEVWPQASYMQVRIDTGRMHQIRVHAAAQGHPVAGDEKYGDAHLDKQLRNLGLRRMFLHAHRIKLQLDNDSVEVMAELPRELQLMLDNLRDSR